DVEPADAYFTRIRPVQSAEQAEQRALARPRPAEQHDQLAFLDRKVDVDQRVDAAAGVEVPGDLLGDRGLTHGSRRPIPAEGSRSGPCRGGAARGPSARASRRTPWEAGSGPRDP